jgi:hypothetical protein
MLDFQKNDWYWQLADGRVWSTAAAAFVPKKTARQWAQAQGLEAIPESPKDEAGEHSELGLQDALAFYGLPMGELATVSVPESVTMRQARLALLSAGLLGQVEAIIAAMPGTEGDAARIEWEYAATVERGNPLFAALAPALGLTDADIDQLFIAAARL